MDLPVVSYYCTNHPVGRGLRPYAVSPLHMSKLEEVIIFRPLVFRPRSMEGGDLRWFWRGFDMFERIDIVSSNSDSVSILNPTIYIGLQRERVPR